MKDPIFLEFKKALPGIKKNVPLKNHTTFRLGGPAKYFLVAAKKQDIIKAITLAKKLRVPVLIMGGGSNLLVSDKGFFGLVVKIQCNTWALGPANTMVADAGVSMKELVSVSVKRGLAGLEWAGGLPGTFGGAIQGNAGAFGGEIKDSILQVEALDPGLTLKKLSNKQCQFSYRNSIFKKKNWQVISAKLTFKKGDKKSLQAVANSRIAYRKEKHPLEYPNAGSVFKNIDFNTLSKKYQKVFLDKVKKDPFLIVPSAWFIIGAGLVGKRIGQAEVSKKHSNYIVNRGNAKAEDVVSLIKLIQKTVKKKYGVSLETEIQLIGF